MVTPWLRSNFASERRYGKTIMNHVKAALASCILAATSLPAAAVDLSYGATITSNYLSRGFTQTNNGAAFQPWVEVGAGGFYGNLWMSSVNLGPDRIEFDLSAGYRWTDGPASFDVGYVRVLFDSTGDNVGEIYGNLDVSMSDSTTVSGSISLGHAAGLTINDMHFGVSTDLASNLTGSATVGLAAGTAYGDAGLAYKINDHLSIDGRVHGGNAGSRWFVISADTSF